jgi:hypothetical protein
MLLRAHLAPDRSLELNRKFVEYQKQFADLQKLASELLGQLSK